ncbi:MAG: 5-formyltetrahydrofolate cyclo-ligase [Idiomarina sp.]|nr:5-formyltetrahydrofolate cyclo-ligase [Idiomarina sp.]
MDLNVSQTIRQEIRQRRRALSFEQQAAASEAVKAAVLARGFGSGGAGGSAAQVSTVALYLAQDGELNLAPLIEALWERGVRTVLPVLHPVCQGHLLFLDFYADTPMVTNRYGILEPELATQRVVPLGEIDLLLAPLVAFDAEGNRLGMGGGFYDRTLAGWQRGLYPHLQAIGVAHDCQKVANIPKRDWDIPLPIVITPSKVWQFPNTAV